MGSDLRLTRAEMRRRAAAYEAAVARGASGADADRRLFWLAVAAAVAWLHHFDLWADAAADAALDSVADALLPAGARVEPRPGGLVHLTSNVLDGGGHVEMLLFWCEHAGEAVVSTEWYDPARAQHKGTISPALPVHRCPREGGPAARALRVFRRLAELRPERLLLHLNPNDVIGLAACLLYRKASGAELVVYDHADTFYWLGASLADRVIAHRPAGAAVARELRGVPPERISLVPLTSRARRSAGVTRESLGVPADATLSLTVAAFYKMRPDGEWDYPRTIGRLLEAHPRHFHLVVGHGSPRDEEALRAGLRGDRVRLLGKRTDVDALLRAADFVVESFPLMGGLFRFDAAREGRPVVAIAPPVWPLIFDMGSFPPDYPLLAASAAEVERMSAGLIRDAGLRARVGARLKAHYEEHFSPEAAARGLREALAGKPFAGAPEGPLAYDPARLARVLGPAPLNLFGVVEMVKADLGYAPPPTLAERVNYLAGYTREAVRTRLGRLRKQRHLKGREERPEPEDSSQQSVDSSAPRDVY